MDEVSMKPVTMGGAAITEIVRTGQRIGNRTAIERPRCDMAQSC